ncbi:MAG: low molecular weight protein arginine phosphatase [Candidatus Omnitrophica bacterium]|nr:low molecular weight protein arginine phosphatase [Candidatus Omnitrophota bacterium]
MKNILFVCTGNSCRSVMAEGLFRKMTADRPGEFTVGSAGISAVDGFAPTPATIEAMEREGVDVSDHRSRRLTADMICVADKIYVMEEIHRRAVLRLAPQAGPKVFLLGQFAPAGGNAPDLRDIPDPIRMSEDFYRNVLAVIRDCMTKLVERL